MKCLKCKSVETIKFGKSRSGTQCYKCKSCGKRFMEDYQRNSWNVSDKTLVIHLIEGLSIKSISRLLRISPTTVVTRIKSISTKIKRSFPIVSGKEYEMDELATYIGNKKKRIWITYAIQKDTGEVIDFTVGSRSKRTMSCIIETVVLADPKRIYTDRYKNYTTLIPPAIHNVAKTGINKIERKNLNLRKDLKRLGRKTICFSKSRVMLSACLKIYFWYS